MPLAPELFARYPELEGIRVRRLLADGPVSRKWLVELRGSDCVLRLDKPAAGALQLDRRGEAGLLVQLAAAGWCPQPLLCAPDSGLLVLPHVSGRPWAAADYREPLRLRQLGELLGRLHASAIPAREFRLAERVCRYADIAGDTTARALAEELLALLQQTTAALCLCHNDPIGGNVIGDGMPTLIDWEFAARGAAGFDLAAVIEGHGLAAASREALLSGYKAAGAAEPPDLGVWQQVYRLTDSLWQGAVTRLAPGRGNSAERP